MNPASLLRGCLALASAIAAIGLLVAATLLVGDLVLGGLAGEEPGPGTIARLLGKGVASYSILLFVPVAVALTAFFALGRSDHAGMPLGALTAFESAVAAIAYVIVSTLLIGDVIGREVFSRGTWGADAISWMIGQEFHTKGIFGGSKAAVFAAIVAGFIGLALASAANAHLRPAFMDGLFRGRASDTVNRVSDVFACLVCCAMAYFAVRLVIQSFDYEEKAAVLYWQLWPIQMVIPYAFFSAAIRYAIFAAWPRLKPHPNETAG